MFVRASMTNLPFLDACFHAVISIGVVHHATRKDISKTISEIHRVLKDKGLVLLNLLSIEDYRYGLGQKIEDRTFKVLDEFEEKNFEEIHHFFTKSEILRLLINFRKINVESIQFKKKKRLHRHWKIIAIK